MADPVKCDVCGEQLDPRGLAGHLRFAHGRIVAETNRGNLGKNRERTNSQMLSAVPGISTEEGAITFHNKVCVTDPEVKEKLVNALKERARTQDSIEA